jgi:CcmD family protein
MTIRSVNDVPTQPGSPARVDVMLVSAPEVGVELSTSATPVVRVRSTSSQEPQTPDTVRYDTTRYDSAWASTEIPSKEAQGFEQLMVGGGKIYVVLAVVLIIWIGLLAFLFSTDRRIRSLERDAD